jgi:O-acetyl-ADP-ribose deacetylase (regulator of RNase III)
MTARLSKINEHFAMTIEITQGNIVDCRDEVIVNAANESLLAGGGVCGAIHRGAGTQLAEACRKIGHCPTGQAVITPGFQLKAQYVIHAVGPQWRDGSHNESQLLARCYQQIFALVKKYHLKSVAIPAISTGIYGFPLKLATKIAAKAAKEHHANSPEILIRFVCYSAEDIEIYRQIFTEENIEFKLN